MTPIVDIPPMIYLVRVLAETSIITCSFIKRGDRSLRNMRCVLRGPDSDDYYHELLAVFDLQKNGDRRVPTDSLLSMKIGDMMFLPEVDGNYLKVSDMQRLSQIPWKSYYRKSFLKPLE